MSEHDSDLEKFLLEKARRIRALAKEQTPELSFLLLEIAQDLEARAAEVARRRAGDQPSH